jgi:hypothetical protein
MSRNAVRRVVAGLAALAIHAALAVLSQTYLVALVAVGTMFSRRAADVADLPGQALIGGVIIGVAWVLIAISVVSTRDASVSPGSRG